jgi:hypothetical protein
MEHFIQGWDWFGVTPWVIIAILVLLPCRYDPAIKMKEWLDDKERPKRGYTDQAGS